MTNKIIGYGHKDYHGLLVNSFYGGSERGRCVQFTTADNCAQMTDAEAKSFLESVLDYLNDNEKTKHKESNVNREDEMNADLKIFADYTYGLDKERMLMLATNLKCVIELMEKSREDERTKTFEKCITELEKLRIVDRLTTHSIEYNEVIDEVKVHLEELKKSVQKKLGD